MYASIVNLEALLAKSASVQPRAEPSKSGYLPPTPSAPSTPLPPPGSNEQLGQPDYQALELLRVLGLPASRRALTFLSILLPVALRVLLRVLGFLRFFASLVLLLLERLERAHHGRADDVLPVGIVLQRVADVGLTHQAQEELRDREDHGLLARHALLRYEVQVRGVGRAGVLARPPELVELLLAERARRVPS